MSERDLSRPGGWSYRTEGKIAGPLNMVLQVGTAVEGTPIMLHLVFMDDGVYLPAVIRKPKGEGPFPAIMCVHGGSGGLGISFLVDQVLHRSYALDRFLEAGYAICYTEGRMEYDHHYDQGLDVELDHLDMINIFRYLQQLSDIDEQRVAFFGVSHGGEIQFKIATELGDSPNGPAAYVPCEPAVRPYLGLKFTGPRTEENLQFNDDLEDSQIDLEASLRRIEAISPDVPFLVTGRDTDHFQGLFKKAFELLQRRGKKATWKSYDHDIHAFHWGPRRSETIEEYHGAIVNYRSGYVVDDLQVQVLDDVLEFLNKHVRDK
jgi:dienelactone hydrolase